MASHNQYYPKLGDTFQAIVKEYGRPVRGGVMKCTKVVRGNYVKAVDSDGEERVFSHGMFRFVRVKKRGIAKK